MLKQLFRLFTQKRKPQARLSAIYISATAGEPMQSMERIEASQGMGLIGDRYAHRQGHWQATDACEVTLISEHDLQHAVKRGQGSQAVALQHGHHRRNLVIAGLRTQQLQDRRFRIGSALFRYHKPRPPCGYLDQIEGDGLSRALGKHSGVCLQVLESGTLRVGDPLEMVD